MSVNGMEFGPVMSPGTLMELNVRGRVNVGGLDDYSILSPLARRDVMGYSGCIRSFAVRKIIVTPVFT